MALDQKTTTDPFVRGAFRTIVVISAIVIILPVITLIFGGFFWIVPLTCLVIGVSAYRNQTFSAPQFSNSSTKSVFLTLTVFSLMFGLTQNFSSEEPLDGAASEKLPQTEAQSARARRETTAANNVVQFDDVPGEITAKPETFANMAAPASSQVSPPVAYDAFAAPAIKSVTTTVDEVLGTYADNQMAGERKFGDAKITISGRVERVREAFGTGILVLRSRRADGPLELSFVEAANDDLVTLTPGQPVKAVCYSILELMGAVSLGDCRSVK